MEQTRRDTSSVCLSVLILVQVSQCAGVTVPTTHLHVKSQERVLLNHPLVTEEATEWHIATLVT